MDIVSANARIPIAGVVGVAGIVRIVGIVARHPSGGSTVASSVGRSTAIATWMRLDRRRLAEHGARHHEQTCHRI
jgi:hypothetical protein